MRAFLILGAAFVALGACAPVKQLSRPNWPSAAMRQRASP